MSLSEMEQPDSATKQNEKIKRPAKWKIISVITACVILLLASLHLFLTRDIPPIDDSDLAVSERVIDPAQNPYPEIQKLKLSADGLEKIGLINKMRLGLEPYDETFVDSVISEHQAELARFDKYAAMTQWQVEGKIEFHTDFPEFEAIQALAKLRLAECMRLQEQGKIDESIDKSLRLMQLGREMTKSRGVIIHLLVAQTIYQMAQNHLAKLIVSETLTDAQLENLSDKLSQLELTTGAMKDTLKVEYRAFTYTLDALAAGKVDMSSMGGFGSGKPRKPNPILFKKNHTQKLFADAYRSMISEIDLTRATAPKTAEAMAIGMKKTNPVQQWTTRNPVGKILFSIAIPAFSTITDKLALVRTNQDLLQLLIAMKRSKLKNGEWPDDLNVLVPDFIDAIPIDQMDGSPLRYNIEARKIYSIGTDFIDDDGETIENKSGPLEDRNESVIPLEPVEK